jgi:hypothetical protein
MVRNVADDAVALPIAGMADVTAAVIVAGRRTPTRVAVAESVVSRHDLTIGLRHVA